MPPASQIAFGDEAAYVPESGGSFTDQLRPGESGTCIEVNDDEDKALLVFPRGGPCWVLFDNIRIVKVASRVGATSFAGRNGELARCLGVPWRSLPEHVVVTDCLAVELPADLIGDFAVWETYFTAETESTEISVVDVRSQSIGAAVASEDVSSTEPIHR